MAALYAWVPVSRGDILPANAVKAGSTKKDGDLYVGRTHGSGSGFEVSVEQAMEGGTNYEIGKINLDNGKVWNLWKHGDVLSGSDKCEVLVTRGPHECRVLWKDFRKGEALPEGFVYGGKTEKDGHLLVGRSGDGVPGKLNLSNGKLDGVLHNLWFHGAAFGHSEGQVLQIKPLPFTWVPIKHGEPLPSGAVLSGRTRSDGDVYVGRNSDGEVGKINLDGGNFHKIWCHHGGGSEEGEILLLADRVTVEWIDFKKGDPIPSEAVLAGHPSRDGPGGVFVAREKEEGVPGKLNVEDKTSPPTAHKLWIQGHLMGHGEGQLLLIK